MIKEDLNTYLRARNVFKNMTKTKKDQYHQTKLDSLLSSVNDSKLFWSKIKYMTGRKVRQINNITTEEWLEHFETLFNDGFEIDADNDIDGNDFDITLDEPNDEVEDHLFNSEITDEEILIAVKHMNKGKAAGPDSIIPETFIFGIEIMLPLINRFFNRLFSLGEYPESWYNSIIVRLHKKGDINDANNYRGISLQNVFSKLYASIVYRRLSFFAQIYGKISEAQSGFKPGYSTIDNAFILRALVERHLAKKGKLYIGFVEIQKAFDSLSRPVLWKVIRKLGIKGKLYNTLHKMYESVKACVRCNGTLTDYITCPVGLKQRCLISPILFSFL